MAKFLVKASYSSEAWATQIANPQNMIEIVGKRMEAMGCKSVSYTHLTLSTICSV